MLYAWEGAKVCDLHNELREIKGSGKEYQRVILLGVGMTHLKIRKISILTMSRHITNPF